ncbi:hypothetical protein [Nocardioides sp. Root151]|uniref:hypothetical protein n=1 Tax=Nocardioides sp. Root151 TaxID=1736475 RepID=UPI0007034248|nr:hypothetical protein [Nocardioides sp. Root151]KQZ66974.1 hypothetical protein ASD66_18395 [Nocardioides sp. Root151]
MTTPIAALRVIILPMMLFPIFLLIAIWFVTPDDRFAAVSDSTQFVMAGVIAFSVLAIQFFGYRAAPSPDGASASQAAADGVVRFRTLTFVRHALAELPLIAGLAMTFIDSGNGMVPFVLGCVATLGLMVWHVLPNDSQIAKVAAQLESRGARVPLREAMYGQLVH